MKLEGKKYISYKIKLVVVKKLLKGLHNTGFASYLKISQPLVEKSYLWPLLRIPNLQISP